MTETALRCASCGGRLAYGPGEDSLVCPFCGTVNEIPGRSARPSPWETAPEPVAELDLKEALRALATPGETEETVTVRCPGCGAEVGLDGGTLADACPFCATPLAKEPTHTHRHPRPQAVLPFALTEGEARARMKDWLGSRWFAPSSLKQFAEAGRPIAGVYIPHYTYDAQGDARYQGMRGDAYHVTQRVSVMRDGKPASEMRQVRKIRWTPVSGSVSRAFDDVLVPASDTLGEFASEAEAGARRWDLGDLRPYRADYLAGFRAEAPSLELGAGFERAARAMEAVLRDDARARIGGDEQRVTALEARFEAVTFKHVLLPVWLAAYRWRNAPYRVIVNGRTGEVTGERPYSWLKIALAVLAALAVAALVAWITSRG